jgi:hypothetical protein
MECIFDKCELVNGILLGLVSGILGSFIFAFLYQWWREYFHFRPRFAKLNGNYKGFKYREDKSDKLVAEPISQATIKHLAENRLEISVTHGELTWIGEITMSSSKFGSIVWQYKNIEVKHFFGFKRCIIEDDFNTVLVIGEEKDGMGKEVFRRA